MNHSLEKLPLKENLETTAVLKQLSKTSRALAELKGVSRTMPNQNILINAIMINEAKTSSDIENIVTTHDEIYKAMIRPYDTTPAAKEVVDYRSAMWEGYNLIRKNKIISKSSIISIQEKIEHNNAGIRKTLGTVIKNNATGEIVYTPPQNYNDIIDYLNNLEEYINTDLDDIDPLIKLAIIHYQFESIHPFYDGNGRTGRILNILYLVLKGIEEMSKETINIINKISDEMLRMKYELREKTKIYSKELLEALFFEFYTKISYIKNELNVSERTAQRYLDSLVQLGFLTSEKIGRERIYKNERLFAIIIEYGETK